MSRLPLRLRLTAAFAAVMALVLAASGYITLTQFQRTQNEYGRPASAREALAQHGALADLRGELLTSLPIVLTVAALGAYLLTAAALRPVERMCAQAASITENAPSGRLDVPPGRDEIARLATTLNDMLARLHTALEHERQFVADAGHELRTPLSLLHTEIELALRHPRDEGELRAALASSHEEAKRLVHLAEDLLLLARTDRHDPPRSRDAAVAPVLRRVAERLRTTAPATVIKVLCDEPVSVQMTEDRLERAVTNLVHNALHHGAGPLHITARPVAGQVKIHVRDHGPGFPDQFLPHAFDRFTQADQARTGTGTGLGLAITAAIAQAAGGSYGAANHPGGADVWISLPSGTAHRA